MSTPLWTYRIGHLFARVGVLIVIGGMAGLLSSCSCGFTLFNTLGSDPSVAFDVAPMVNNTSALAVDVVLVYDDALVETLMALPATEWFATREQLRKDHPDFKKSYEVWPLELVPARDTTLAIRELRCVKSGIVFANYFTPGDHRVRFVSTSRLQVALGNEGFDVSEGDRKTPENP